MKTLSKKATKNHYTSQECMEIHTQSRSLMEPLSLTSWKDMALNKKKNIENEDFSPNRSIGNQLRNSDRMDLSVVFYGITRSLDHLWWISVGDATNHLKAESCTAHDIHFSLGSIDWH